MTRPPALRLHTDEMIVDNFAGGGGASLGIEWALGRSPDIAVNHDPEAIEMHRANHPRTRHYCESVWDIDPRAAVGSKRVGLAWFSPDCAHFSKAKGGAPARDKKVRGLAWVVVRWAKAVRPRVIILENVEEFQTWGPLLEDGSPCPERRGRTFRRWMGGLERQGYRVERRELRGCDYGAPTTRKRLFVVARCDGLPIVWPEPTHGPSLEEPHRIAAECIEWALPCPSIFSRTRPLAENTLRRIARGLRRYVIEAPEPYIVGAGGPGYSGKPRSVGGQFGTVLTENHSGLVVPHLINTRNGEREGQRPRVRDVRQPFPTVTAVGSQGALVAAFLARHYGGNENDGAQMRVPFYTVTARDHHALVSSHILKLRGTSRDGQPISEPLHTITAGGNHYGEVRAFLLKYYGTEQDPRLSLPLSTVTTRDRFGLVTVHGEDYAIADIGMRMLVPRELYRAQGFPDTYTIEPTYQGKVLSKSSQVRMCGNSVCPPLAAALARAQFAAVVEREAVA